MQAVATPTWRRVLVGVLVVLGCVLAPLSALSVWLKTTLLDTDTYVATMAPLAHDAKVQNALADRITPTLTENSTVTSVEQQIVDRLPEKAKFIAPKVTDAFASVVHEGALKLVQSDQFATLWEEANRRGHTRVVALLEGGGDKLLQTKNGEVTIDLGRIADQVNSELESRGVDAFSNAAAAASDTQIVLIDSIWLKRSQNATDLLQRLAIVLPIVTLFCFVVAIWLSPNRRRTVLRAALGVALGMAVLLIAMNGGRHFYLDALPSTVNSDAAKAVYDQVLETFRLSLRASFVAALIVALTAWLSGPGRSATALRESVLRLVRGRGPAGGEASAFGLWVARNKHILRVSVIAVAVAGLVFLSAPTPAQVIAIAVFTLLLVLLIEFLARRAPKRTPA